LAVTPAFAQGQGSVGYIAPNGEGDGSSPENAASLNLLGELVRAVGAGGTVAILADRGSYDGYGNIEIAGGGSSGAPVRIVGINGRGQLAKATIRGNRRSWRKGRAVDASDFGGDTTFVFGRGSSNLHFMALSFADSGRIFDFSDRRESNIVVEDVDFLNVRDGFYTNEGSNLGNVVLRRFSGVGFSKKAVRVHGRSNGWLIENCQLDSGFQYGDNFAVGIEMNHSAHNITISGGFTINCLDTQGGDQEEYWNADGVASEEGNRGIRISDHYSAGHSDGGYDLKSEDTILARCVSEDNKRNYRIWGGRGSQPMLLENCQSRSPRSRGGTGASAHLWLFGSEGARGAAASAIFRGGAMSDSRPGSPVVYADGNNVNVHLVDADLSGLGRRETLIEGEGEGNVVLVGSAADPGLSEIVTAQAITAVEGFSKTVPLVADGDATWRIVAPEDADFAVAANNLVIPSAVAGSSPVVIVQARGSNGEAIQKELHPKIIPNPLGVGTALAVTFAGRDGATSAEDATGLNVVEFSGEAHISDNALVFSRGDDYVTIPDSDNLSFSGPFTIDTEFLLDNPREEGGQDVVTHWGDASRQRGYEIRCEENGILVFAWTYDGSDKNVSWIEGPELEAGRFYKIRVDRDDAGTVRLYVDGQMVGSKDNSGEPILNSAVSLRISGRADGKYGANGRMRSLLINNGHALTGSESGYQV
jgi:hypothetical protein